MEKNRNSQLPSACTSVTYCAHFLLEEPNWHQLSYLFVFVLFVSLSPYLSSETCYSNLCSCSFPPFPSLSRGPYVGSLLSVSLSVLRDLLLRSLLLLFFLPSPLSLSRDPSVGSSLSVSPSFFRDLLLRSLLLLFSSLPLSLSLSFERSPCRLSAFCLPIFLQRCLSNIYPYVGSLLSVSPSVFRDLILRSLLLLAFSFE